MAQRPSGPRGPRPALVAVVALVAAAGPVALTTPCRAAEVTDIVDGFERSSDRTVDFTLTAGWAMEQRQGVIRREFRCLAHDTIPGGGAELCPDGSRIIDANEMTVSRLVHRLDIDLRLGFWRVAEIHARLPIVLLDRTDLDFYEGVDPQNSTVDPYNQPSLFGLPNRGARRVGVDAFSLGARLAPLSLARDMLRPDWIVDIDLSIPASAFGADVREAGNHAVTEGVWEVSFATALSARPAAWVEPYFQVGADFRIPDRSSLFYDYGRTQTLLSPGHAFHFSVGTDFLPYEDRDKERAFIIDIGGSVDFQLEGRDYTDLFDALGTSGCDPRDSDAPCDLTTYDRGTLDPDTGFRRKTDGLTDVEQFATLSGWLGVRYQLLKWIHLAARFTVAHETAHFITFSDAGKDFDGDGVVEDSNGHGDNEFSPVYNDHYDALGARFRTGNVLVLGFQLALQGKF